MSDQPSQNNKRIAKNTLYMYFRMGITMLVQLYTSRVVLENLGIENYGIYNIVGAFIVAFTFISGPLGTATQRFINFELGKKENNRVNLVFNISLYAYAVLALILFLIIEFAGEWFLYNKMQLPEGRLDAAQWAFQLSVVALMFSLVKTPFESMIVAHERMVYYAYISIAEVLLKLLNAASLAYFTYDKLKLYALNQFTITLIIFCALLVFCHKNFLRQVQIRRVWDKKMFLNMLNFSGWSLFGSVASMSANQGLNILLNMFYGVVVNAAMGIATQVSAAVNQFVTNFQIAFRPQIVKYYAAGEIQQLNKLIMNSSKYSYLLLFGLVCPLCLNIDYILKLWLKNPPEWADEFTIFMLIYALLETLSAPMWMTVQATGKIRNYQLIISSLIFLNIILSYIFLKLGFSPVIVLIIKCWLDMAYLITRLLFMRTKVRLSIRSFIKEVMLKISIITAICLVCMLFSARLFEQGWLKLLISSIEFIVLYGVLVYSIGLSLNERNMLRIIIRNKIKKIRG